MQKSDDKTACVNASKIIKVKSILFESIFGEAFYVQDCKDIKFRSMFKHSINFAKNKFFEFDPHFWPSWV